MIAIVTCATQAVKTLQLQGAGMPWFVRIGNGSMNELPEFSVRFGRNKTLASYLMK